jgi:hypothetical protein
MINDAFEKQAWHGPNLRGSLRGVNANQAFWRPVENRHNIWELALHCAYWKYAVRRRLTGEKRGSFPRKGSNWLPVPEPSEKAWRDDLKLLGETHRALIGTIKTVPLKTLEAKGRMLYGIALHDTYHTGQIQLLKRMYGV